MSVAVAATPASPRAEKDATVFTVTGGDNTTPVYVKATAPSSHTYNNLKSQPFELDSGGGIRTLPWIFPEAGSWTVGVYKVSDDSLVGSSLSLTVQ